MRSSYVLSGDQYMRGLESTGMLDEVRTGTSGAAGTGWVSVGPAGNPLGTSVFGAPYDANNGRVRSIHIRPEGGSYYVYVGASSGGLWRALASSGKSWTSLGDGLPNPSVGAFAVNPGNPDDILVGTGDWAAPPSGMRYPGGGMFHSINGGPWNEVSPAVDMGGLPVEPGAFFRILYPTPGNASLMLSASDRGVLRSTNGADGPWGQVFDGVITDLVVHPTTPNVVYCCRSSIGTGNGGIFRSVDSGEHWTSAPITAGYVPVDDIGNASMAICRDAPNYLAYVYEDEGTGNAIEAILISGDGGVTWTATSSLPGISDQASHALAISFRPTDPTEIYVGSSSLDRTNNGGASWTSLRAASRHDDQTQLYFSPVTGDNVLWICNDGGIYRHVAGTTTSESWLGDQVTGLRISQISYFDAVRDMIVAGRQDDGTVATVDRGASWSVFSCCDGAEPAITDDIGDAFWFSMGAVYRQDFSGSQANYSYDGLQFELFYDRPHDRVYTLAQGPSETLILGRPESGLGSWTSEGSSIAAGISGFSGCHLDGNTLFGWNETTLTVLQRSGNSWVELRSVDLGQKIMTVYASKERPGESWAGLASDYAKVKLMHTTDYWATRTNISEILIYTGAVEAIVSTPFAADELYVGTDIGVFHTSDGGATWYAFQDGMPVVECKGLAYIVDRFHTGNDRLLAATFGHGVYERIIQRSPVVYVDLAASGTEEGTFEHPFDTFAEGWAATPNGGILALRGSSYTVPMTLDPGPNRRVVLDTYGGAVVMQP